MAATRPGNHAHGRHRGFAPPHRALRARFPSAGVSATWATRMSRSDRRPLWTNCSLTRSPGRWANRVRGAPPSDRPWAPPPHRPLRSSGWPHSRARPMRPNASGADGASGASHERPERPARPTSNAVQTRRIGSARSPRAPARPPSAVGEPAPRARPTQTVAATSAVSPGSAACSHRHTAGGRLERPGVGTDDSCPFLAAPRAWA
jgi:hypothetical protein